MMVDALLMLKSKRKVPTQLLPGRHIEKTNNSDRASYEVFVVKSRKIFDQGKKSL